MNKDNIFSAVYLLLKKGEPRFTTKLSHNYEQLNNNNSNNNKKTLY